MTNAQKDRRNKAFLVAYDANGQVVEELVLSHEEYYEGSPALIDSADFRASRGIVRLAGKIFDPSGKLGQEFETHYDGRGKYVRGRSVHQDGTVIEN